MLDFRQSPPIPFSDRRAILVEEFQRRAEMKNTAPGWPSPLAIVVRYGMVRRLICGAVQELVVVPAGDGLVSRRIRDLQAKRVVHDALKIGRAHV